MIFPDFYEWCEETFKYIREKKLYEKYNFFIKPHPNRLSGEDGIINAFKKEYPFLNVLSGFENNISIIKSKPKAIITVYGTIASEFTFAKIPVISCGDNPTSSFNITYEAKTKKEYFSLIENAEKLFVTEEMVNKTCAFAYMYFLKKSIISFEKYPFKRYKRGCDTKECNIRIKNYEYNSFKKILDKYLNYINYEGKNK